MHSFTAIDTETTGLSARFHKLIQISAVRFVDGNEAEHFDSWIRVPHSPKQEILDLVGVSWKELQAAPPEAEVMEAFKAFLHSGEQLVLHNAPFDLAFLAKAGFDLGGHVITDTQCYTKILHLCPDYKLGNLSDAFGIVLKNAHNALADARATGELYLALKEGRQPGFNKAA